MTPGAPWRRGRFLGAPLDLPTVAEFRGWVLGRAVAGGAAAPALAGYQNAWTSNLATRERDLARFFAEADVVYADGMAVVWGARLAGLACPERVNAGDFVVELLAGAARPLRVALVGGAEGLAARAAERLRAVMPEGSATWAHHGYLNAAGAREAMAAGLRAFGPDLVLLGMGSPRQERLGLWLRDEGGTGAGVVWCVGALFEYVAGARYRAPVWVRRVGMEWAVRLALEPRRMWRRYVVGNVVFVARVAASLARRGGRADGR